jgi:SAM-dependent methyltransferase
MTFFQALYDRNRFVRAIAHNLGFSRPINLELESPRIIEYPWVLRNLPSEGKILDVGSTGSQIPVMLACLGYHVWTIDVRDYEYAGLSENLHSVVGDIRRTSFPDGFFDVVVAVSTVEHVGLGRYGDPIDLKGDRNAIKEVRRVMTSDGILLITVPFGKRSTTSLHRVYDEKTLLLLLEGFEIQSIECFLSMDRLWVRVSREQVKEVDSSMKERAIACVKAVNTQRAS